MKKFGFVMVCVFALAILAGDVLYSQEKQDKEELLFPIEQDGKFGFIKPNGKLAVKPEYRYAEAFSEGLALVCFDRRSFGFITTSGKVVFKKKLLDAGVFSDGLARVKEKTDKGEMWGYIAKNGKAVIECKFKEARDFSDGLAAVEIDGKWGFIDKKGKTVIDPEYTAVGSFSEGLAPVLARDKWGYVDKEGKLVVKPQFVGAWEFSEGLAPVNFVNAKAGAMDVPARSAAPSGKSSRARFGGKKEEHKGKFGFVDKTGKVVVEAKYESAGRFSEGMAPAKLNGKCGFIDKEAKFVIEAKFEDAKGFRNGTAAVNLNGKWGYIDKKGEFAVKPRFNEAHAFSGGLASVSEGGRNGYVDAKGKYVWRTLESAAVSNVNAAAAEASAISALRTLSSAEELYKTRMGVYGDCTDLNDGRNRKYIDPALAAADPDHPKSKPKNGYYVDVTVKANGADWSATAWPVRPGKTGTRSFFISSDGVIYYRKCTSFKDALADGSNSKVLGSE